MSCLCSNPTALCFVSADPRASGTTDVCCVSATSSLPAHTVAALVNDFNEESMQCRRVKCYEADQESGQWEEKGVGYVYLAPNADSGSVTVGFDRHFSFVFA